MNKKWVTRHGAVTEVKYHSTRQGKKAVLKNQSSGGQKITLVCSTHSRVTDPRFECQYKAVLRKSKSAKESRPWHLVKGQDARTLSHSDNCLGDCAISVQEALLHTKPTAIGRSKISIESTAVNIAKSNKIPRSAVSPHVANKVRLIIIISDLG